MTTKSSSRPSLLNRLKSKTSSLSLPGLRPSRRTLTDFHIRLNDPHRVYSPTDIVKGSVCVTVDRPLNLTHLVVNLVGRVDLNLSSGKESGKRRKEWDAEYDDGLGGIVLCRDEIVLCGEGRLEPGVYEFGFDLMFVLVGKMVGGLPSSLDFEKGSISYTISSTLTRPTAISPTTTCTTKINLVETIDIAHLQKPKPHIISLEPIISRRSRKRPSSPATTPSVASSPNSSHGNLPPSSDPGYLSPAPNPAYIKSKTITASIEMMKAGALRGDNIPIKISIRHTKPIKSLNGIILTLYRQTRFDPAHRPQPPLKKALSSAAGGGGGGGTFRKDLSQTVMPLIVDPNTLTTVVRANLRVPEDVFPTINSVPGGEVSFRYWVEVVVDLGGKLSGRDDIFIAGTTIPGLPRPKSVGDGDSGGRMASEGGIMIETERIKRREKSVVFCKVPVVIGSVDSVTGKGRRAGVRQLSIPQVEEAADEVVDVPASPILRQEEPELQEQGQGWNEDQAPDYSRHPDEESHYHNMSPLPHEPGREGAEQPHEEMDEKTRMNLAEQTLLPSAPPGLEIGESSGSASAPPLTLEETPGYYPSAPPLEPHDQDQHDIQEGDDKQEAERRRLLAAASSPDDGTGEGSSGGASAPVLDEHDLEGGLPRYRR